MLLHRTDEGRYLRCREKAGQCPYGGPVAVTPTRDGGVLTAEDKHGVATGLPLVTTGRGAFLRAESHTPEVAQRLGSAAFDLSDVTTVDELFVKLEQDPMMRSLVTGGSFDFVGGRAVKSGRGREVYSDVAAGGVCRLYRDGRFAVRVEGVDAVSGEPLAPMVWLDAPSAEELRTGDFLRAAAAGTRRGGRSPEQVQAAIRELRSFNYADAEPRVSRRERVLI